MLAVTQLAGFGGGGTQTLRQILTQLGLTTSLNLCLDAGDLNSYPGSGQTWSDVSGSGNHYYLGSGSGSDAADPTFNGTAGGLSQNEYFSHDGGDYFSPVAATTFDDNWHKNNGACTLLCVGLIPTGAGVGWAFMSNTDSGANPNNGLRLVTTTSNKIRFTYDTDNTGASGASSTTHSTAPTNDVPNFFCASFDEAVPQVILKTGGAACETTASAASTNTTSPSTSLNLSASGAADAKAPANFRAYLFAAWSRALSTTEIDALYTALKAQRFPSMPATA